MGDEIHFPQYLACPERSVDVECKQPCRDKIPARVRACTGMLKSFLECLQVAYASVTAATKAKRQPEEVPHFYICIPRAR